MTLQGTLSYRTRVCPEKQVAARRSRGGSETSVATGPTPAPGDAETAASVKGGGGVLGARRRRGVGVDLGNSGNGDGGK